MIIGKRLHLRKLNPVSDDLMDYVKWMNDPDIVKFTMSKGKSYNIDNIKDYIIFMNNNNDNYLLGIFLNENNNHIGNIKVGPVDFDQSNAFVGLIIGEKQLWGKGYATEAIELATNFAFKELQLSKLFAMLCDDNQGSYKAFSKAGYAEIKRLRKFNTNENKYIDEIIVEISNEVK